MDPSTLKLRDDTTNTHEFTVIYSGPTFEKGVEISDLIENLKSIQELIKNIADVNAETRTGNNSSKDIVEIRVQPRQGSLEEHITIVFSNPEVRAAIVGLLISLLFYLLQKREAKKDNEEQLKKIDQLINKNQLSNAQKLYQPLKQQNDSFRIEENNIVKIEINFNQKNDIDREIERIESEGDETNREVVEGYLSAINVDSGKHKFHPRSHKAVPMDVDLPIATTKDLLARPVRANMLVTRRRGKIIKMQLIDYKKIDADLRSFGDEE